ncbi:hypothetical protein JHD46_08600, partial [Sulfurimonas sp. SAG-AH-194-C20]
YIKYLEDKKVEASDVVITEATAGMVIYEDVLSPLSIVGNEVVIENTNLASMTPYLGEKFIGNIIRTTFSSNVSIKRESDLSAVNFSIVIIKVNPRLGTRTSFDFNQNDDISLVVPASEIRADDIYICGIKITDTFDSHTNVIIDGKVTISNIKSTDTLSPSEYTAYIGTRGAELRSYISPPNQGVERIDFWNILGKGGLSMTITALSERTVDIVIGENTLGIGGSIEDDRVSTISINGSSISLLNLNMAYNAGRGSDFKIYDGSYSLYLSSTPRSTQIIYKNLVPFDHVLEGVINDL